jgi:hypothetical protein
MLVLAERVSWNEPVGALIVIAGIAVSQDRLPGLVRRSRRLITVPSLGRVTASPLWAILTGTRHSSTSSSTQPRRSST